MRKKKVALHSPPLSLLLLLAFLPASPASADVVFFVQRHGSADTGWSDFHAAGPAFVQDFEGNECVDGAAASTVEAGLFTLDLEPWWTAPIDAEYFSSNAFDEPDQVDGRALYVGAGVTFTPRPGWALRAFGTWIFDDMKAIDAGYRMEVVEADGSAWQVVLVNEMPQNLGGHEVEGFVGAVSDVGIASVTITAIDPFSGVAVLDGFEIDHVAAGWPPQPVDEPPVPADDPLDPPPDPPADLDDDAAPPAEDPPDVNDDGPRRRHDRRCAHDRSDRRRHDRDDEHRRRVERDRRSRDDRRGDDDHRRRR